MFCCICSEGIADGGGGNKGERIYLLNYPERERKKESEYQWESSRSFQSFLTLTSHQSDDLNLSLHLVLDLAVGINVILLPKPVCLPQVTFSNLSPSEELNSFTLSLIFFIQLWFNFILFSTCSGGAWDCQRSRGDTV